MSVRDDLGSIECLLEVINELLLVALERFLLGTRDDLACTDTLFLDGRQASGKDGLTDKGDWGICKLTLFDDTCCETTHQAYQHRGQRRQSIYQYPFDQLDQESCLRGAHHRHP